MPRWCSGRRRVRPPARSPHASLWLGVVDLEARPGPPVPPAPSTPVEPGVLMIGSARRLEARPGPAAAWPVLLGRAAVCAGGRALLWSLRHYANPSNNERPGPQPHKQTLNNVRTRPVVQCLPMGRCAYPRLGLLVWALHPIRRHYTPSVRVQRHVTGAAPRNGCVASGSSPAYQSTHASSKDTPPPTCAQAHPVTHSQL